MNFLDKLKININWNPIIMHPLVKLNVSRFVNIIYAVLTKLWWSIGYLVMFVLVFVYPFLWGFYFAFIRYLRFGSTLDVSAYFYNIVNAYLDYLLAAPFLFYYIFIWFCFFLWIIRSIRLILWGHFVGFFYVIHIRSLQYNLYFYVIRALHKVNYLLREFLEDGSVFRYNPLVIYKKNIINRFFSTLYLYPFLGTITFFSTLCLELMITRGCLYFGVYTLFYYPLITAILRCLNSHIFSVFVSTVNESDFYYGDWRHPRYPYKFWARFPMDKLPGNTPENVRLDLQIMQRNLGKDVGSTASDLQLRCHGFRMPYTRNARGYIVRERNLDANGNDLHPYYRTIRTGNPKPFCMRLKSHYYFTVEVRWYHTSATLYYPITPLNPLTLRAFTPTGYMDVLALVNHPGSNFTEIQQLAKNIAWPSPASIHVSHPNVHLDHEPRKFINTMESNQVSSFRTLADKGVIVGTFPQMMSRVEYTSIMSMQQRPDIVLQFKNSPYRTNETYGIDHKTKDVKHYGRNQIVTPENGDITRYKELVYAYEERYFTKFDKNPEITRILKKLRDNAQDSAEHQHYWASHAHLFPPKWQPPLYADRSFKEEYLTPENKELFLESQRRVRESYIPSTSIVD
jgi:hypothetical protein